MTILYILLFAVFGVLAFLSVQASFILAELKHLNDTLDYFETLQHVDLWSGELKSDKETEKGE